MNEWMNECMYVCMYVCMHVCMYVCMYVCAYRYNKQFHRYNSSQHYISGWQSRNGIIAGLWLIRFDITSHSSIKTGCAAYTCVHTFLSSLIDKKRSTASSTGPESQQFDLAKASTWLRCPSTNILINGWSFIGSRQVKHPWSLKRHVTSELRILNVSYLHIRMTTQCDQMPKAATVGGWVENDPQLLCRVEKKSHRQLQSSLLNFNGEAHMLPYTEHLFPFTRNVPCSRGSQICSSGNLRCWSRIAKYTCCPNWSRTPPPVLAKRNILQLSMGSAFKLHTCCPQEVLNTSFMCNVWQSCREPLAHVMQCEEFISRHACTMHNCLAWYVCKASMKTSQVDQIKASWAHVARKVPQKCMYHAHLPSLIYSILAWQPPCVCKAFMNAQLYHPSCACQIMLTYKQAVLNFNYIYAQATWTRSKSAEHINFFYKRLVCSHKNMSSSIILIFKVFEFHDL